MYASLYIGSVVGLKLVDGFWQMKYHLKRLNVPRDINYMTSHKILCGGYKTQFYNLKKIILNMNKMSLASNERDLHSKNITISH